MTAGCDLLRAMPIVGSVSLEEIIRAFLRKSHTVTFVCVVDVYQASWGPGSQGPGFEARFWASQRTAALEELHGGLNKALRNLPVPFDLARILRRYEWAKGASERIYSGYKQDLSMSGHQIEISLRATAEYLAGRIDRVEYERWVSPDCSQHLRRNLDLGNRVSDMSISRRPDRDDDSLVVTFGEPDPAMSPFHSPPRDDHS